MTSTWRVTLVRPSGESRKFHTETIDAESRENAEISALSAVSDEWAIHDASRVCDFCNPAPHENCEAETQIQVVDPSERFTGGEESPGTRTAWVCLEHYQVVKDLETVTGETLVSP